MKAQTAPFFIMVLVSSHLAFGQQKKAENKKTIQMKRVTVVPPTSVDHKEAPEADKMKALQFVRSALNHLLHPDSPVARKFSNEIQKKHATKGCSIKKTKWTVLIMGQREMEARVGKDLGKEKGEKFVQDEREAMKKHQVQTGGVTYIRTSGPNPEIVVIIKNGPIQLALRGLLEPSLDKNANLAVAKRIIFHELLHAFINTFVASGKAAPQGLDHHNKEFFALIPDLLGKWFTWFATKWDKEKKEGRVRHGGRSGSDRKKD